MKKHNPTAACLIRARCDLAGLTVPQVAKMAGLAKSTVYSRLSNGGWTLAELRALDRVVHFEDEDLRILVEAKDA